MAEGRIYSGFPTVPLDFAGPAPGVFSFRTRRKRGRDMDGATRVPCQWSASLVHAGPTDSPFSGHDSGRRERRERRADEP